MSQDDKLQQAVRAELSWEPSVISAHIGVSAQAGVVTLSGQVQSYAEKRAAEATARRVNGVRAVVEEIEVQLPLGTKRSDSEIASAAVDQLAWDVSVPDDAVTVKVEKGWVTLSGEVAWHYQQQAAEHDVRRMQGVTGISNQITIKPVVDAAMISDDIMHALHRSWFFDPKTVTVTAEGGTVRLRGTVQSWHDRHIAEETAWAAPGATAVENDLTIV